MGIDARSNIFISFHTFFLSSIQRSRVWEITGTCCTVFCLLILVQTCEIIQKVSTVFERKCGLYSQSKELASTFDSARDLLCHLDQDFLSCIGFHS